MPIIRNIRERVDKKVGPGKILMGISAGNITKIVKIAKNILLPIVFSK
jgi:hypothetical protein